MCPGRAGFLGLDVGGSALKIVLCSPEGAVLHKPVAPAQGRPGSVLAGLLAGAPAHEGTRYGVRIAVTGSGHALARSFPAIVVNEVVATARGPRPSGGRTHSTSRAGAVTGCMPPLD